MSCCIELEQHFQQETPSRFNANVFDGAAIVHALTRQQRSAITLTPSSFPGLKDNYNVV